MHCSTDAPGIVEASSTVDAADDVDAHHLQLGTKDLNGLSSDRSNGGVISRSDRVAVALRAKVLLSMVMRFV